MTFTVTPFANTDQAVVLGYIEGSRYQFKFKVMMLIRVTLLYKLYVI